MDHVAIMKPSWKLIPKILAGEKTMESRWYQTRRAPWGIVSIGDRVFFKDSGKSVIAVADVSDVMQFTLASIDHAKDIIKKFGKKLCLVNTDPETWGSEPRYCILIALKNPRSVEPFMINKKGFGSAAAWISVDALDRIRL
jgi:hypothetical protein